MTIQEQEKYFNKFVEEMRTTLFKKGQDYSNEDRLSNFKVAGAIVGLTPEMVALTISAVKIARLATLFNSKSAPQNESVNDSVLDLTNYGMLLSMIINEDKQPDLPF